MVRADLAGNKSGTDVYRVSHLGASIPLIGRIMEPITGGVFGKVPQRVPTRAKPGLEV
jgi:hypothetical protein